MPDYGMEEFPESGGHAHNATRGPHWLEVVGKAHVLTDRVAATAAFVILSAMSVVVLAGVISRYVFNDALSWSEEFALWSFTWLIFTGAAVGIGRGGHVAMRVLTDMLPERWQSPVAFLRDVAIFLTMTVFVLKGMVLIERVGGTSPTLGLPNPLRYSIIPISGVLGAFLLLTENTEAPGVLLRRAASLVGAVALYFALEAAAPLPVISGWSQSTVMLAGFFLLMFIGTPISFCLVGSVVLTTWTGGMLPAQAVLQNAVAGAGKFILLAIPFFLSAGYLLNLGGLSGRLIDFAGSLVGHFRGGLAHVNVLNSLMLGGVSGSTSADAATTTKIIVPEMVKRGYSPAFSCAVTAASALLPNVVPPAIAMLVFASAVDVSIAQLFIGGVVPGFILAFALMVTSYIIARRRGYEAASKRAPLSTVWSTFLKAFPVLVVVVVVLGGIRFGVTTATEAGVMTLFYVFLLGKFVFNAYSWGTFFRNFRECGIEAATVAFLIAASAPFAWVLIADRVPQDLVALMSDGIDSRIVVLLLMTVFLLGIGMFLDLTPAMLITAPLFMPVLAGFGVDPVQAGIVMIIALQLGGVTPPVGILVFVSAQVAKVEPGPVFRAAIPFIFATLVVIVLLEIFPALTTGLWHLLG
ncbi:TRAP transporter large permease [Allosediminivita pacifica]|uniref:Tripartite ATP-independent transporter DctM subunit n=1 Tax=Allosediminivita pacifica TaxID=1267769 RepID=A0A2T6AS58_9RHOB|nr:TRAP transporter large permease subunit [Allosediminivita pacifica]PTX46654.1 tripartite ATP-independent transporter DctM subunit [Allosediminivita pacifica]GGB15828.1 ABC transporter permease [Allosediminivita pacifica]